MSNHENDDEVAGPSIMGSDDRRYSGPDTAELTNAQTIIEMLQVGFNGASSTGLSQDDMELSSKTKWLILDPTYYLGTLKVGSFSNYQNGLTENISDSHMG